jgi:hypothetical protein
MTESTIEHLPCESSVICTESRLLASRTRHCVIIIGKVDHAHVDLLTRTEHIGEGFVLTDVQSADVVPYRIAAVPDEVVTWSIGKSINEDRVECLYVVRLRHAHHVLS